MSGAFAQPSARFGAITLTAGHPTDGFLSRIDGNGKVGWALSTGDVEAKHLMYLALDSKANLIISGQLYGEAPFGPDITLTSSGDHDVFVWKVPMRDGAPVPGSL